MFSVKWMLKSWHSHQPALASYSFFQRFSIEYFFALIIVYVQEKSFSSSHSLIFSIFAYLKCCTFHSSNSVTEKVSNNSGEIPYSISPDNRLPVIHFRTVVRYSCALFPCFTETIFIFFMLSFFSCGTFLILLCGTIL